MRSTRLPLSRLLPWIALAVFTLYAVNFLYYFVDDEGIPYVYAQNLLRGNGLTYSSIEGPVEGYSDFLHVLESAGILWTVRTLGLPKIAVFFVGKAFSLLAGAAVVLVVLATLRRLRAGPAASAAGLAALVLSGPLAVWSCSSLEAVPVALGVAVLAWALVAHRDRAACFAAIFLALERIDGFVYVGALVGAFLLASDPARRRQLGTRVVAPVGVVLALYHGWRVWYFGALLPTPLQAKVLYKLGAQDQLVEKKASAGYVWRFVQVVGWPAAAAFVIAAAAALWRRGPGAALALAALALTAYVSIVGDWMFGFRFFLPVIVLGALVLGYGVEMLGARHPVAPGVAAVLAIVWFGSSGAAFVRTYVDAEGVESFLRHPSRDVAGFFHPYYSLYVLARAHMAPGTVVADNQAGFVPYMLDLDNIDDLGICSAFYASLPTTDVVFTEVGKYLPLTNRRIMRAGEAYLVYQDVRYLLVRSELLRSANGGHLPPFLLGGYYEWVARDDEGDNAIYRRTDVPADGYQETSDMFMENLAHVSYTRSATVDGQRIEPALYLARFPYLWDAAGSEDFSGTRSLRFDFGPDDAAATHLSIGSVVVDAPATLELTLMTYAGRVAWQEIVPLDAGIARTLWFDLPEATRVSALEIRVSTQAAHASARFTDVRVLGQRERLRAYITRRLTFPPAPQLF